MRNQQDMPASSDQSAQNQARTDAQRDTNGAQAVRPVFSQPEFVGFYGRAETITGDVWWWTDGDGNRHPLLPKKAETVTPPSAWHP